MIDPDETLRHALRVQRVVDPDGAYRSVILERVADMRADWESVRAQIPGPDEDDFPHSALLLDRAIQIMRGVRAMLHDSKIGFAHEALRGIESDITLALEPYRVKIRHANGVVEVLHPEGYKGPVTTCGACGRHWDDSVVTSVTPVPSGRCPFEYEHDDID